MLNSIAYGFRVHSIGGFLPKINFILEENDFIFIYAISNTERIDSMVSRLTVLIEHCMEIERE